MTAIRWYCLETSVTHPDPVALVLRCNNFYFYHFFIIIFCLLSILSFLSFLSFFYLFFISQLLFFNFNLIFLIFFFSGKAIIFCSVVKLPFQGWIPRVWQENGSRNRSRLSFKPAESGLLETIMGCRHQRANCKTIRSNYSCWDRI